ncbi:unnamed protein product [Acanthoscelides obtectus]|uniref:C-type lectin domain-containing protein n=1 Tax=Acanthoscelides obtectus TaxID=200917 RepID=A0A9P0PSV7_ACAOB|nr:unnamed protein product [Acanthoscelides obtectus]CAK1667133.1 hypothetical protein AOBTE_LOCUS25696 [Acanthoscelides obtectus]
MDSKSCVVVIALVAVSSGLQLQTFHNTTVVIEAGFPGTHRGVNVNLSSTPYLPLVRYNNILYYFGTILPGNKEQVDLFCNYHNMKLVSIQSAEESENLIAGLEAFFQSSEVVLFWTSGRRHDNFWRWDSTGRPIHYTNWEKGEPNNSGGTENCLQLRFNTISKTLQWNDCACDASSYFICESRD